MVRNRVLSALVLVPLVLALAYLGRGWYLGLILLALTLAGREYADLLKRQDGGPSAVFVIAMICVFVLDAYFPDERLLRPGLTLCVLGTLTWAVVEYERGHTDVVGDWAWTAAGGLYLGGLGAYFILVRQLPDGLAWVVLALAVGWLTDTGAFLVGRARGKHKMSPHVSPLKTWEGYVGGVIFATVSGVIVAMLIRLIGPYVGVIANLSVWDGLALGSLISILSPLGDLGESMIKRHAGAKDSGRLIPGHGGAFDRIDSLLWAAVIAFYYVAWVAR